MGRSRCTTGIDAALIPTLPACSAGYIPRTDLTAIAIALYGVICIILWSRESALFDCLSRVTRLTLPSLSIPDFFRHGRHKWMLTLTIGTTCACASHQQQAR